MEWLVIAGLAVSSLVACEPDEREVLQKKQPNAKVGQPREGYVDHRDDSPLTPPDEFLRTKFELKSGQGIDADVRIEEVTAGVRIGIIVEEGEPGRHFVVVHEGGDCTSEETLTQPLDLAVQEQPEADEPWPDSVLGAVQVGPDGEGRARWLTAWGDLRSGHDKSLLDRPIALYRASEDRLGTLVACGKSIMN